MSMPIDTVGAELTIITKASHLMIRSVAAESNSNTQPSAYGGIALTHCATTAALCCIYCNLYII